MTVTRDDFLGGRLQLTQPARGHHRSGIDTVFLAASCDPPTGGLVVDLGAGVGGAGLCLAVRRPDIALQLVERNGDALEMARQNVRAFTEGQATPTRVAVIDLDITQPAADRTPAGLRECRADRVMINPPYHRESEVHRSPDSARAQAHVLGADGLDPWIRCANWTLKPGGRVHLIFRADGLEDCLVALRGRFGELRLLPLFSRPGRPAHRILISARKGARGKIALLPGMTLHPSVGDRFTAPAEAVLRHAEALPM